MLSLEWILSEGGLVNQISGSSAFQPRPIVAIIFISTMPFFKRKDSTASENDTNKATTNGNGTVDKVNFRARLEHKTYLATESPEPVYDISECALKNVPSGVFSRCMIGRKEALLLQNNELTALNGGGSLGDLGKCLQVLDLHHNQLEKLPNEIGLLKSLRVLYVHHNKLKKLPDSIGDLFRLQSLDLRENALKELPSSMSKLKRLRTLDLSKNVKLKKLPKSLGNCHSLDKLIVDTDPGLQYPPVKICSEGTEAMMRFLAKECDISYIAPSAYVPPDDGLPPQANGIDHEDPYAKLVRGSLQQLDKQKEAKKKEIEAMERERMTREKEEAAMAASMQNRQKKLLNDLAEEEAKREDAVRNLQQMKDKEKEGLITSLSNVENETDAIIDELMKTQKAQNDPQKVLEEMERERREMEEMFTIKADEVERLREKDVLRAMQSVMQEEMRREMLRTQYEQGRKDAINSALSRDIESDMALEKVLATKGQQQQELIGNLLEDEKYQREAFRSLFMKEDARHSELCMQVEQIQSQLASLTMVEMTKKDLKVEFEKDVMREKRETLTEMLMSLMDQKEARQAELSARLNELEKHKSQETDNYWLIQYQKLLDAKPQGLLEAEKAIDPDLKDVLVRAGAEDYVPILAIKDVNKKQVMYMNDKQLSELGIHNGFLRQKILSVLQEEANAAAASSAAASTVAPSAPVALDLPSAPPLAPVETYQSNECVVCLENKCNIIFLPCGHVCACWKCEAGLTHCPLCRTPIAQKVRLN